jgi:hypothetical protein
VVAEIRRSSVPVRERKRLLTKLRMERRRNESVQIEGKPVIEDGNVVEKGKSDVKAKHGRRLGILVNQNSRKEPKKLKRGKFSRRRKGITGWTEQQDVEDRERGRRLGNEKWKD